MDFVALLQAELRRRRATNPRYSLRRFAQALGISHATLSRLCQRRQQPRAATITALGERLGLAAPGVAAAIRRTDVDRLLKATRSPRFKADARWLAAHVNLSLDDVQLALHEGLRTRRLTMAAASRWRAED